MHARLLRWLVGLSIVGVALLGLSFGAAAVMAEGAIHPLLKRRPTDTAALAYSIAKVTDTTARRICIRASDGVLLDAWWLAPNQENRRAVMVCHGVADSAHGALGYAPLFLKHGYSVLLPESRGHGESRGFVTYGVWEARDVVQWLCWMKRNGVTDAFGFGESLGGSILIQALAQDADFRAVIAECPYSSFEAIADERVARVIPAPIASVLVKEGMLYVRLHHRVNLWQARPDAAISHARVPILLIHGLADNETSPEHSERLAHTNPSMTKLWLVPGARHTGSYATAPALFERTVLEWFAQTRQPGS